ncbi:uncharacterized protein LOC135138834 [Zophobas morio]|uniref:uncharacterized protein LOC135138834 n=1 Tax=Zophobas morio TaxID=2755281 RepID=UPI003083BF76
MKLFNIVILYSVLCVTTTSASSWLRNKTHIYCPALEATPYVTPPTNESKTWVDFSKMGNWTGDWNITKSSTSSIGPVVDMRWTYFDIKQTKTIILEPFRTTSLSIFAPFKIKLFIVTELDFKESPKFKVSRSTNQWLHYTFVWEKNCLKLYENGKTEPLKSWNLPVDQVTDVKIISKQDILWKLHDYKPTTLTLNNEASCLAIYTILCPTCYLAVFHNGVNIINITSNTNSTTMKTWQSDILKKEFKEHDKITFFRRKTDNNTTDGFWDFDVSFCLPDFALYIANPSTNNYTCHTLNEDANPPRNNNNNDIVFCEEPGKLGRDCQTNCSEILGPNYPNCEGHQLCTNETCVCPWGHTGKNCTEDCKDGNWGLDCKRNCTECGNCDKKSGKCLHQRQITILMIIVGICSFIVLCVFYTRKHLYQHYVAVSTHVV